VKTRFQSLPFKCNLHRYTEDKLRLAIIYVMVRSYDILRETV
jgi:hypothetical protein